MIKIALMRTPQQAYDYIHKEDPESSISLWYIRSLIKQKKIPVCKAGNKNLINIEILINYLNNKLPEDELINSEHGKIRRVIE